MKYFEVVDLDKFQHYKDRTPPWFKIHARGEYSIFDWYEFTCLHDASKLHLILIWGLATKMNNRIPYDPEWVKSHIKVKGKVDLKLLEKNGFIKSDSEVLADCQQVATPEGYKQEGYKQEGENHIQSGKPDPRKIIEYLNQKASRSFSLTPKHLECINSRIKEGFAFADFTRVVDKMVEKWGKDGEMMQYLRPVTLFGTKFDSYLNMPDPQKTQALRKPSTFESKRAVVDNWLKKSKENENDQGSISDGAKDFYELRGTEPGRGDAGGLVPDAGEPPS